MEPPLAHGHRRLVLRDARLQRRPLLTIWGMVRMFEAVDAVALAAPTAAHRAAVNRLAARSVSLY